MRQSFNYNRTPRRGQFCKSLFAEVGKIQLGLTNRPFKSVAAKTSPTKIVKNPTQPSISSYAEGLEILLQKLQCSFREGLGKD